MSRKNRVVPMPNWSTVPGFRSKSGWITSTRRKSPAAAAAAPAPAPPPPPPHPLALPSPPAPAPG